MNYVSIQTSDFNVSAELTALKAQNFRVGAICSFVGTVRTIDVASSSSESKDIAFLALELEHYPLMTEQSIHKMIREAQERFDILSVRIIHRVGILLAGEQIVLVAVSSSHRADGFQACEFLMDYLKTQAPFWKKEHTIAGAHWVDARESDDLALARWGLFVSNASK